MCIWDGSNCVNDPELCGYNIGSWRICETTVVSTNPNTNIYIYNDDEVGHWSVYDSIEEKWYEKTGRECARGQIVDFNGDGEINIRDIIIAAKNFGQEDF